MKKLYSDFSAAGFSWETRFRFLNLLLGVFLNPGFRAVLLFRFQEFLLGNNTNLMRRFFAFRLCVISQRLTGAEFVPGCEIGSGLVVKHPAGIVVGEGVVIGENCTLQHGVTLGKRFLKPVHGRHDGYPTVAENVQIGTHAVIVGPISIGPNSVIGANSTITKNVGPDETVYGNF